MCLFSYLQVHRNENVLQPHHQILNKVVVFLRHLLNTNCIIQWRLDNWHASVQKQTVYGNIFRNFWMRNNEVREIPNSWELLELDRWLTDPCYRKRRIKLNNIEYKLSQATFTEVKFNAVGSRIGNTDSICKKSVQKSY